MVQHIPFWNVPYRGGQLAQNVSEQTKIDVHVDRFADILGTGSFEDGFLTESTESRARKYRIAGLAFQAELRGTTVELVGEARIRARNEASRMDGRFR